MAKSDKTERRAAVDHIRQQQKRADQRQGAIIIGVCVLVGLIIIGMTAYRPVKDWWDLREFRDKNIGEIGAAASVCGDLTTKPAEGSSDHVSPGVPVEYADAPPAFGQHEDVPESMEDKFYTEDDRPNVEKLVHNLEHGWTLMWYDETIAEDDEQLILLEALAQKLAGTSNMRTKFKAVPWTKDDGKAFPEGQHIAFTHWAKESEEKKDKGKEVGVWQYCSEVSGEALEDFMLRYPYTNSIEPLVEN